MKLITRDTDYAIRALCCIAGRSEEIVSVKELVLCLNIPRAFLRKILQRLNKSGILKSYKGKGGGFSLTVSPADIYVSDLMKIFQGSIGLQEHTFNKRRCPETKTCPLKKKLDVIERYVITSLSAVSLASLFREKKKAK